MKARTHKAWATRLTLSVVFALVFLLPDSAQSETALEDWYWGVELAAVGIVPFGDTRQAGASHDEFSTGFGFGFGFSLIDILEYVQVTPLRLRIVFGAVNGDLYKDEFDVEGISGTLIQFGGALRGYPIRFGHIRPYLTAGLYYGELRAATTGSKTVLYSDGSTGSVSDSKAVTAYRGLCLDAGIGVRYDVYAGEHDTQYLYPINFEVVWLHGFWDEFETQLDGFERERLAGSDAFVDHLAFTLTFGTML